MIKFITECTMHSLTKLPVYVIKSLLSLPAKLLTLVFEAIRATVHFKVCHCIKENVFVCKFIAFLTLFVASILSRNELLSYLRRCILCEDLSTWNVLTTRSCEMTNDLFCWAWGRRTSGDVEIVVVRKLYWFHF